MYKSLVRTRIRRQIAQLNSADFEPLLATAAPDAELAFPGNNSWSRQFRPPEPSRAQHTTHRGRAELEAFARRFVAAGLHLEIEDILVNGPPWNLRVAVRATNRALDAQGNEVYNNRIVAFIESHWGRIHRWEDYLDTERVAAWDRIRSREFAGQPAAS